MPSTSSNPHHRLDLRFRHYRGAEDEIAPQETHVRDLLAFGQRLDQDPKASHLVVHCHMGVYSTASMILLLAQARPQRSAEEIAQEVVRIRPIAWPNLRIITMGDRLLGRKGELITAARGIYRRRAAKRQTMRFIRDVGRLAELEGL
ncbi:MAG: protein-tyrosine-phosphatase [Alphaproteobacteria bacterium]